MNWLSAKLGRQRLLDATVLLPTNDFFPDKLDGSAEDARRVYSRICKHIGMDPNEVELQIGDDASMEQALGLYIQDEQARIIVNQSELRDSESLVATLCHELAHHLLLGGGLLTENNLDLERLTDLLPVFLGIGIFSGNAVLRESHWREGRWSGWSIKKQGYLPGRMFAYGFSLFAYARAERKPKWPGYLRHDLSEPFWRGLRFLNKTGDTLFGEQPNLRELSINQLLERLQSTSATVRYVTLWELEERGPEAVPAVEGVLNCLGNRDIEVGEKAVRALARIKSGAAVPALKKRLSSFCPRVRASAAQALGQIAAHPEAVLPELRALVHDSEPAVQSSAVEAIGNFKSDAAELSKELWPVLKEGLLHCDYDRIGPAIRSLRKIVDSPRETITNFLKGFDREVRIVALEILDEDEPADQSSPLYLP